MATVPNQASTRSDLPGIPHPFLPVDSDYPTVEESPQELDLIGLLRQSVSDGSQPIEAILASVADAARVMSGADGTALALETGGKIVCRARSGSIAPGLGSVINSESGISGECLRAATILVCHDTLSDPRVDAEVCQALGIRSIAAIPLLEGTRRTGIIEAFAARPDAFDGDALSSLRALSDVAQLAYQREHLLMSASSSLAAPVPVAAASLLEDPSPAAAPTTTAVPSAPAYDPLAPFRQIAKKYTPRTFTKEELFPSNARPRHRRIWVAAIAIGLLAVAVAWWSWHSPDEGVGNTQTAHAATVANVNATPATRDALPKPVAGVSAKRTASHPNIVLENAAEIQPESSHAEDTADSTPASTPSVPVRSKATEVEAVEAPAVSLSSSGRPEEIARLASIEPQMPVAGPTVSQGVIEAVLLHRIDPAYPLQARTQRLSGRVVVSAMIGTDGAVQKVLVVSGSPLLVEAAKSAVKQWRYRPATLNGSPVEVQQNITFVFNQP